MEKFNVIRKVQRFGKPDSMIDRLIKNKVPFLVRKGSDCTEIILDKIHFTYTSTRNFPREKLFLFKMVKKDAENWLDTRGFLELPPEFPATVYNYDYDDSHGRVIGTDLNHAYWKIAYQNKIIQKKTYEHGLGDGCKALRLATLSVLGREKSFKEYEDGEVINKIVFQEENLLLKNIFKYVRLVCFNMMHELSIKLGEDFDCYKTDCIYYRDTPENVKIVQNFFKRRNIDFKQLDHFETENEEK